MDSMKIIYIVDDSMVSLNIARDMLKDSYKIYAASSAEEFFRMIEVVLPDLVLMDVGMPKINGYEAIKILKADKRFANIPVIFLTGKSDNESELKGFELGAVDYITKPFHKSILKARINTHITIVEHRHILEQISLTDSLTKIPNRRFFDDRLELEWARTVRYNQPIGMIMIDIDDFKVVNDSYGHQQGDMTLQTVAHVLNTSVRRGSDSIARWGGEEFVAILPDTDYDGVFRVAENVRINVGKTTTPLIDDASRGLSITVSIGGVSALPLQSDSIEGFIKKSDNALYEAKRTGKNKVCMYES